MSKVQACVSSLWAHHWRGGVQAPTLRAPLATMRSCAPRSRYQSGLVWMSLDAPRSSAAWPAGGHASPLRKHFSPAQPVHIAPNVPQLYKGTASDGGAHAPFKNHTQLSSLKWCSQVAFFASSVRLCYPTQPVQSGRNGHPEGQGGRGGAAASRLRLRETAERERERAATESDGRPHFTSRANTSTNRDHAVLYSAYSGEPAAF